jgi:hypothetical protein
MRICLASHDHRRSATESRLLTGVPSTSNVGERKEASYSTPIPRPRVGGLHMSLGKLLIEVSPFAWFTLQDTRTCQRTLFCLPACPSSARHRSTACNRPLCTERIILDIDLQDGHPCSGHLPGTNGPHDKAMRCGLRFVSEVISLDISTENL